MSETSIASARASVMIYDDVNKKWIPSGTSSGLSKVHIFQHNYENTFRVVGRKLNDHEVVINCIILRSLKYNQATETFHQWRDNKKVYGLNFSSKNDADAFARAMNYAIEILASNSKPAAPPVAPHLNVSQTNNNVTGQLNNSTHAPHAVGASANGAPVLQANGQYEEDMGYRTMTKEDMVAIQDRRMSQQAQSNLGSPGSVSVSNSLSVSPQLSSAGHQRTSSAPPAPQPPPMMINTVPPQPPTPPAPAPPCPPPMPNSFLKTGSNSEVIEQSSLAAQLQSARLRRSNRQSAENSGSSTSSSSGSNYGTLGRNQSGMASMMDEMAKTLARRRAAVEKKDPVESVQDDPPSIDKRGWSLKNNVNGCESPKTVRKLYTNCSEELATKINGDSSGLLSQDMENLKQEIMKEIKKELTKVKQDIVEAIKMEMMKSK